MHTLHRYLASLFQDRLCKHRVVILYDPREEFGPFLKEAEVVGPTGDALSQLRIGETDCHLARFTGSFFRLRHVIEPIMAASRPEPLLVHISGVERDGQYSLLMEADLGGLHYHPRLRQHAREVLRKQLTEAQVDQLLEGDIGYNDVVRYLDSGRHASVLKAIFGNEAGERLIVAWLLDPGRDSELESKGGTDEMFSLLRGRIGLEIDSAEDLSTARREVFRYLLVNEFRMDYKGASPGGLERVPRVPRSECRSRVRTVVGELRDRHADEYAVVAEKVQADLQIEDCTIAPGHLGPVDTFPFEEAVLLEHVAELLAASKYSSAESVIEERQSTFWATRDTSRQTQWEVCRRIATLGLALDRARSVTERPPRDVEGWVEAYVKEEGLHRVDALQRSLEACCAGLDDEPVAEVAIARVRSQYAEVLGLMANGFTDALEAGGWSVGRAGRQTDTFAYVSENSGHCVAYFLVDALRYEMGVEVAANLHEADEVSVDAAIAAIPTITPVGMAALMPDASANFSVVDSGGGLASRIGEAELTDWPGRWREWKSRVPGVKEFHLDDVIRRPTTRLSRAVESASLVLVRSQEIDAIGESEGGMVARHVMVSIVRNIVRAVRKLTRAGITRFVIAADHGHLFAESKDDDMKIDAPGGHTLVLHRRCWVGRGGSTPAAAVRISAADLGYDSDLDFVFPRGTGVFRAGGGLSYHHGGISLQEMVVPVLRIRMPLFTDSHPTAKVEFVDAPSEVTTRAVGVTLALQRELFTEPTWLRVVLMAGNDEVGLAGMAAHGEIDRDRGTVKVDPDSHASIGLMLTRDDCSSVRIVVLDPGSDAILAQTSDIPVRISI